MPLLIFRTHISSGGGVVVLGECLTGVLLLRCVCVVYHCHIHIFMCFGLGGCMVRRGGSVKFHLISCLYCFVVHIIITVQYSSFV